MDGLTLVEVLNDVHEARKVMLDHATKEWVAKAMFAETAGEACDYTIKGIHRMTRAMSRFHACARSRCFRCSEGSS